MTKTRHSIFETNSSSVHTLTLGEPANELPNSEPDEDIIYLGSGEYGWSGPNVDTWLEKADYLAIEAFNVESRASMLFDALHTVYPNTEFKFDLAKRGSWNEGSVAGYIDHQSYGEVWSELNSTQEVIDFLFGSGYIKIDNDNY